MLNFYVDKRKILKNMFMKYLIITLISLMFLSGCANKKVSEYNSENDFIVEDSIPISSQVGRLIEASKNSLHDGVILEYAPRSNVEHLAMLTLKKYFRDYINGNFNRCIQYMYDDVFKYTKDQIPEMSMKDIKQGYVEQHKEMNLSAIINSGLDFLGMNSCDIVVSKLTSCVKEDNKIIMIGDVVWQFYGDNNVYSEADPMLVISLDNGNSWKIAGISIDTSSILRYKFSEQSINIVSSELSKYGIHI